MSENKFEFPNLSLPQMQAHFAPFRSRSVMPQYWDIKMKFWTDLIEKWCKVTKCPVVEISTLKSSFTTSEVPQCLEEVIHHLNGTGVIVKKDDFMSSDESWENWVFRVLVTKPLKWALNTVKSTVAKQSENQEVYVHLPAVKYLGEELIKAFASRKMYSYDDLVNLSNIHSENLSIVLHWLHRQGRAALIHEKEQILVKLGNSTGKVIITETDLGIYHLEMQQKLLEENLKKLTNERNAALKETKDHLAAKNKTLALMSLRKKRALEKTIEKRAITLENCQAILLKIEQAKLDVEVVECYKTGVAALKKVYEETGLNAESVTATMDEVEELLNSQTELEDALSKPMDPSLEASFEDELNRLLVEDAPEVPDDGLPVKSPEKEKKKKSDLNSRMEALCL